VKADTPHGRHIIYPEHSLVVEPGDPESPTKFDLVPDTLAQELHATLEKADDALPFRLTSRRSPHVFNSSGHQYDALAKKGTSNYAWMNPADMERLGLVDEQLVEIAGKRGALRGLVKADEAVRPGVISMSHAFGDVGEDGKAVERIGATTSRLVDETVDYDPITGQSLQSAIPVNVAPA
jgi:anaerobic selenocysteine-containing dehydrogenase